MVDKISRVTQRIDKWKEPWHDLLYGLSPHPTALLSGQGTCLVSSPLNLITEEEIEAQRMMTVITWSAIESIGLLTAYFSLKVPGGGEGPQQ